MISTEAVRRAGAVAFGVLCLQFATTAFAYTPEQQQACTGDAMRLCGEFVPDVDRITACMVAKKSMLTPVCRAHFGPPPRAVARPVSAARTKPAGTKPRKTARRSS